MFCTNCREELEQNAKFCKKCGKNMEAEIQLQASNEKELVEKADNDLTSENNEIIESKIEPVKLDNKSEYKNIFKSASKGKYTKLIAIVLVGLLVLGIGYPAISSSFNSEQIIYLKENEELFSRNLNNDNYRNITKNFYDKDSSYYKNSDYAQSLSGYIKMNDKQDRIVYLDNISEGFIGSLYYRNPKKDEESTRLASNVNTGFKITKNADKIIYMKDFDFTTGGKLYLHNLKDETLIDKDVSNFFRFSKSENEILYTRYNESDDYNNRLDIYIVKADKNAIKEKIDQEVDEIIDYTSDFETIFYTKRDSDTNEVTLYKKVKGNDRVKIASGLSSVPAFSSDGTGYYIRTEMSDVALYDFVEDDMVSIDANIGNIDFAAFKKTETYVDYWGDYRTRVVTDWDAYYQAKDKYDSKLKRDRLRASLRETKITKYDSKLFYFDGKDEKVVTEGFNGYIAADPDNGIIIYDKLTEKSMKKINIKNIYSTWDVENAYYALNQETSSLYISYKGNDEMEFAPDVKNISYIEITPDGKQAYYLSFDKDSYVEEGTLIVHEISHNFVDNGKEIDDDVFGSFMYDSNLGGVLYYKDVKNEKGELYMYSSGKTQRIDYDVRLYESKYISDDGVILYLTDYSEDKQRGTLKLYKGGSSAKIADDVSYYHYMSPTNILYITEYRSKYGNGELWQYKSKKANTKIDDNVSGVLTLKHGRDF